MATQTDILFRPGNVYLNALVWGGKWSQASGAVKYAFGADSTSYDSALLGQSVYNYSWTSSEQAAIKRALADIAKVANIDFVQVPSGSSSNLQYLNADNADLGYGTLGISDVPGSDSSAARLQTIFNWQDSSWSHLGKGGYGYATIVHEILHSLGLAHPHDHGGGSGKIPGVAGSGSGGTNGLNQQIFTIMSYNDGDYTPGYAATEAYGYAAGAMAFDIAALQYLYGANTSTAKGNTTYTLPTANEAGTFWECIWDTGGRDTIRAGATNLDAMIDLRPATLKEGDPHAGGFVSQVGTIFGGFTIAKGVKIENAVGGNGHDTLNGNGAANELTGRGGSDKLFGRGRGDDLDGGSGRDLLNGGVGNDSLDGGVGNDTLNGGKGRDTAVFDGGQDNSIDLRSTVRQDTGEGRDKLLSIENVNAGDGADSVIGNGAVNRLSGQAGRDDLRGLGGNDQLFGGGANDTLFGGDGRDTLVGGAGNDLMNGGDGRDVFKIDDGSDNDRIAGFTVGLDDVDLRAHSSISAYRDIGKSHDGNGNAVADLGGGGSITFVGLRWSDLSADDFLI
ncbi:MAG: hypothetical protein C0606_12525 [Hyphomicrobiales bacterium]|nr:MAG: hypothetical protein C0606_12525 [Hyphomicrobiales bacterium]